MTPRCVEQISIPMFERFSLTAQGIIIATRLQIHFDMLDVADAWFQVSILFSVPASGSGSAYIDPPEYVSIHFMPTRNTAT